MDHRKVQSKAELKQELADSRHFIGSKVDSLLNEMNFAAKVKRSINEKPFLWGAVAFVGAIALIKLITPAKRPVIVSQPAPAPVVPASQITTRRRSRIRSLFSLGVGLATPHVKAWLSSHLKRQLNYLKDKYLSPSDTHH